MCVKTVRPMPNSIATPAQEANMVLAKEIIFEPITIQPGDKFNVSFQHNGVDRAIVMMDSKERKFNVLRVYETDSFEDLKGVVIAVLGWKEIVK